MLRKRLETFCNRVSPEKNVALVDALMSEIPHSIVPVQSAHDLFTFTCLVHALGFTGQVQYLAVAGLRLDKVFAGKAFASWLLQSGSLTEVSLSDAVIGSLVIYFDGDGEFVHVGLSKFNSRVESKWGQLGLYEHGLFEVPANYGDTVRYYKHLPYPVAIKLFYDFAAENGFLI